MPTPTEIADELRAVGAQLDKAGGEIHVELAKRDKWRTTIVFFDVSWSLTPILQFVVS